MPNPKALEAIRRKLIGYSWSYDEAYAVIKEIANGNFNKVLTTYYVAAGYAKGFSRQELYFLTKAMVETGHKLKFNGVIADKHCIGGLAGNRTTLIVIPIVAAAGFTIPKSSSKGITSPSGSADTMEVLAPVNLSLEKIKKIIKKANGCIIFGGHKNIAPADNKINEVEKQLCFESYDKIVVSVMAKKIASGSTHLIIDIPLGPQTKVRHQSDAEDISGKFRFLAAKFAIKIKVLISDGRQPIGSGIGPVLEARDVLRILQQKPNRPKDLEEKSIMIADELMALCSSRKNKLNSAKQILKSGRALEKMRQIIQFQGGNPQIDSEQLKPGPWQFSIKSKKNGIIKKIDNRKISDLAHILGCPEDKKAGLYLKRKLAERTKKKDLLYTIYSSSEAKLNKAIDYLKENAIYVIKADLREKGGGEKNV